MKIIIDFKKNRSLGNVYDKTVPDNQKEFEAAELLYSKNTKYINDSVLDILDKQTNVIGMKLEVPTLQCNDKGFINSLQLELLLKTDKIIALALVNTKL